MFLFTLICQWVKAYLSGSSLDMIGTTTQLLTNVEHICGAHRWTWWRPESLEQANRANSKFKEQKHTGMEKSLSFVQLCRQEIGGRKYLGSREA